MKCLRANSSQQSSCCSLSNWKNISRCSRYDKILTVSTIICIAGLGMAAAGGVLALRNKNEVQVISGAILGVLGMLVTCVAFVYSSIELMNPANRDYTQIN